MANFLVPVLLLTVIPLPGSAGAQLGQPVADTRAVGEGPDYSRVDSQAKAEQMARQGLLVPLLMLPEMFGGDHRPGNVLYVPPFVAENKRGIDEDVIKPLVAQGKVRRYDARPVYSGNSFVPTAVLIHAYDPADFNYRIEIWGGPVR